MTSITYNGLSFQGSGIFVNETDVFSPPKSNVQSERLAETDGSIIVKQTYDPKVFRVDGYLTADTITSLDTLLDTFKAALNVDSANFDIDYAGSTRRYVATPQNLMVSRPLGLNAATYSVEFLCPSGVGTDTTSSTLLSPTAITTSTALTALTAAGTYVAQPLITLTLSAVTGATSKAVTITNSATLRGITVTRTWTAGDVLEIDCLNKTVYVNNAVVDYSGQFPRVDPGTGGVSYLDEFTTRTASLTLAYTRRYL